MGTQPPATVWFRCCTTDPHYRLRLFCFPYAGGGASIFSSWPEQLPPFVQLCSAQLPGRERRMHEPPTVRLLELARMLAQAILPYLDRPFAFFGYSMGALISFELARELRRLNAPSPALLFVANAPAPHISKNIMPLHLLPDADLMAALRRLHDLPPEALQNAELMNLILPILRADLTLCESYAYLPEARLNIPVVAIGGTYDYSLTWYELSAWAYHTHGFFTLRTLPAGHFFMKPSEGLLLQTISEHLIHF